MTIHDCHAAGMSLKQAADAIGISYNATVSRAKRAGLKFPDQRKTPEWAARICRQNKDAAFAKARYRRWRDPKHNPLVLLTTEERAEYDFLKRNRLSRNEALKAIGRLDILEQRT
jgi:hypothetical protein